jgi:hypothetical protein
MTVSRQFCFLIGFSILFIPAASRCQSFSDYGNNLFVTKGVDLFTLEKMPAALSGLASTMVGVMAEQPFLLGGLSSFHAAAAFPNTKGNLALMLRHQGSELHQYQKFLFGYARKLGANTAMGIHFNLHRESFIGYGSRLQPGASLGCSFRLSASVQAAMALHDPAFLLPEKKKTFWINSHYLFSLQYNVSELFNIICHYQLPDGERACFLGLIEYKVHPICSIRAGANISTGSLTLAAFLSKGQLRLLSSFSYHPVLGLTPAFGIASVGGGGNE